MGIRTTVTLDEDVLERVKQESKSQGLPFKRILNELLRDALASRQDLKQCKREFHADAIHMGPKLFDFSYDCIPALLDRLDGPAHR
jgi:hypothetical protein